PPEEAGPERWASARAAGFLRDFSPDPGSQPGAGVHGRGLCVESRGHVPSNLDQLPAVLAVGEVALERRPCPRVQEPERVTYRALLIVFGVPRRLARHLFVPRRSIPVWNTSQAMVPFPYTLNVSAQPLRAARAHMGDTCAQSPGRGGEGTEGWDGACPHPRVCDGNGRGDAQLGDVGARVHPDALPGGRGPGAGGQ